MVKDGSGRLAVIHKTRLCSVYFSLPYCFDLFSSFLPHKTVSTPDEVLTLQSYISRYSASLFGVTARKPSGTHSFRSKHMVSASATQMPWHPGINIQLLQNCHPLRSHKSKMSMHGTFKLLQTYGIFFSPFLLSSVITVSPYFMAVAIKKA